METALLLMQLHQTTNLVLGAALGSVAAAGVAWLWSRYGHRVNLALFFQATAIFLFVFVVQLVIKGAHEMSEQQYLPYSEIIHSSTEAWGPDSTVRPRADLPARDPAARRGSRSNRSSRRARSSAPPPAPVARGSAAR